MNHYFGFNENWIAFIEKYDKMFKCKVSAIRNRSYRYKSNFTL